MSSPARDRRNIAKRLLWPALLTGLAWVSARAADATAEDRFRDSVWPLLEDSCVRCHGPDKQKGDLRLDGRDLMLKGGKSGTALVPGKPDESLLLKLVRHEEQDRAMPPKETLSDAQVGILERWIAEGAPWPAPREAKSEEPGERMGDAWSDPRNPIVRLFGGKRLDLWSLNPLVAVTPPALPGDPVASNPIDAFVLDKLKSMGVPPAPEADRRTLARRLYFDLTGLPPSPEEMSAFLADAKPTAYEDLVDKLLDSPHYGEHWGRLWLDVVRYADSNGFDWDEFRPQAWRFRDYVIRAWNEDKPFDQFVKEQLAGDEMVPGAPRNAREQELLVATGYLRAGPYDNSAKQFGEYLQCRTQVMSDLVETTGAAFLGLNMSCCRCHNHKFDPISQRDYYRMRAFFETMQPRDDLPLDFEPRQEAIRQHNDAIEAQLTEKHHALESLLEPVANRLREVHVSKLSADDMALLKRDLDTADAKTRKLIRKLGRFVDAKPEEVEAHLSPQEKKRRDEIKAEIETLEKQRLPYELGLLATDGPATAETHMLYQGDCRQPREIVAPGFLSVLDPNPATVKPVVRPGSSGRRSALADWIVSRNNPLTARVFVNRIWQAHLGEGLVATPNDFGFVGARPTHPELLDWLAGEFMRQGWSIKKLQRLIVTSATYRRGLGAGGSRMFAGQMPRRLSAEALRDSMLCVSGRLLPYHGGPPLWPELPEDVRRANPSLNDFEAPLKQWQPSPEAQTCVRSVYLVQKRSVRVPFMETFDLPENTASCPQRTVSTAPPQALALLNDAFSLEMAKSFAERLAREVGVDPGRVVDRAFALALQRPAAPAERSACLKYLQKHNLTEFCRVLLNLNEFCYVD